jgi:hypothetical protein
MIMPLLQWIVPDLARRKPNKVQRVFSSGGTAHAVVRNPLPSQVKLKTLRLKGSAIPLALTRDCVRSFAHIGPVLLLLFYWMDCGAKPEPAWKLYEKAIHRIEKSFKTAQ